MLLPVGPLLLRSYLIQSSSQNNTLKFSHMHATTLFFFFSISVRGNLELKRSESFQFQFQHNPYELQWRIYRVWAQGAIAVSAKC